MEKSVKMSLVEFERLTEVERRYNEGKCELFFKSESKDGAYESEEIYAFNADEGMKLLAQKLVMAERRLYKKKWYQFAEKK